MDSPPWDCDEDYQFLSALRTYRHGVMKDVIRIVTPFDALQEWIKALVAVIKLWPVSVLQHVLVRIVDIAALVVIIGVGRSLVVRVRIGAGVQIGVEVSHPSDVGGVFLRCPPGAQKLQ